MKEPFTELFRIGKGRGDPWLWWWCLCFWLFEILLTSINTGLKPSLKLLELLIFYYFKRQFFFFFWSLIPYWIQRENLYLWWDKVSNPCFTSLRTKGNDRLQVIILKKGCMCQVVRWFCTSSYYFFSSYSSALNKWHQKRSADASAKLLPYADNSSLPFPVKGLSASQWHGWLPLLDEGTFEGTADGWTPLKWNLWL